MLKAVMPNAINLTHACWLSTTIQEQEDSNLRLFLSAAGRQNVSSFPACSVEELRHGSHTHKHVEMLLWLWRIAQVYGIDPHHDPHLLRVQCGGSAVRPPDDDARTTSKSDCTQCANPFTNRSRFYSIVARTHLTTRKHWPP